MKFNSTIIFGLLIVVLIAGVVGLKLTKQAQPGQYDQFAQCIYNSGIKFYGAFWCPHCAEQKKEFGTSVKLLPYVECSMPDQKTQTQVCIDNNITSYPTWVTASGTRYSGVQSFEQLAQETGCTLPQNAASVTPDAGGQSQAQ